MAATEAGPLSWGQRRLGLGEPDGTCSSNNVHLGRWGPRGSTWAGSSALMSWQGSPHPGLQTGWEWAELEPSPAGLVLLAFDVLTCRMGSHGGGRLGV